MTQSLIALDVIARRYMPKAKKAEKPKEKFKPVKLATAVGDAYKAGYIDGLKEQSAQLTEAEKIIQWIHKTEIEERIDYLIDAEIERYFVKKMEKIKRFK